MKKLTFKSNINCAGCLSKVKPILNKNEKIEEWNVDLQSSDKIVTIKGNITSQEIINDVEAIGFSIQKLS